MISLVKLDQQTLEGCQVTFDPATSPSPPSLDGWREGRGGGREGREGGREGRGGGEGRGGEERGRGGEEGWRGGGGEEGGSGGSHGMCCGRALGLRSVALACTHITFSLLEQALFH